MTTCAVLFDGSNPTGRKDDDGSPCSHQRDRQVYKIILKPEPMMQEEQLNKLYFIRCPTPALQSREAKDDYSQQFQKTRAHLHVWGGSKGGDAEQYWRQPSPVYRYTHLQSSVNIYAPLFTLYHFIRTLNSSYSHLVLSTLCWCWTLLIADISVTSLWTSL